MNPRDSFQLGFRDMPAALASIPDDLTSPPNRMGRVRRF